MFGKSKTGSSASAISKDINESIKTLSYLARAEKYFDLELEKNGQSTKPLLKIVDIIEPLRQIGDATQKLGKGQKLTPVAQEAFEKTDEIVDVANDILALNPKGLVSSDKMALSNLAQRLSDARKLAGIDSNSESSEDVLMPKAKRGRPPKKVEDRLADVAASTNNASDFGDEPVAKQKPVQPRQLLEQQQRQEQEYDSAYAPAGNQFGQQNQASSSPAMNWPNINFDQQQQWQGNNFAKAQEEEPAPENSYSQPQYSQPQYSQQQQEEPRQQYYQPENFSQPGYQPQQFGQQQEQQNSEYDFRRKGGYGQETYSQTRQEEQPQAQQSQAQQSQAQQQQYSQQQPQQQQRQQQYAQPSYQPEPQNNQNNYEPEQKVVPLNKTKKENFGLPQKYFATSYAGMNLQEAAEIISNLADNPENLEIVMLEHASRVKPIAEGKEIIGDLLAIAPIADSFETGTEITDKKHLSVLKDADRIISICRDIATVKVEGFDKRKQKLFEKFVPHDIKRTVELAKIAYPEVFSSADAQGETVSNTLLDFSDIILEYASQNDDKLFAELLSQVVTQIVLYSEHNDLRMKFDIITKKNKLNANTQPISSRSEIAVLRAITFIPKIARHAHEILASDDLNDKQRETVARSLDILQLAYIHARDNYSAEIQSFYDNKAA